MGAQRSRYFGPDGSWNFRGNGSTVKNLNSDFFYKRIIDSKTIEGLLATPPVLIPGVLLTPTLVVRGSS